MNRWYFWVLAPVMLASAIIIPVVAEPPSIFGRVLTYISSCTLVLATLGLANPRKFHWALRSVAAVVLFAIVSYFASEFMAWRSGKPLGVFGRRSSSSLRNASLLLLIAGLPALRYLFSGRSGSVVDVIAAPDDSDSEGSSSG